MLPAFVFMMSFFQIMGVAHAQPTPTPLPPATHTAKVDLELKWVDAKGKSDKIESKDYTFSLNWNTQKCHIKLSDKSYAPCLFDHSKDLLNANGELIMKGLPQAHFGPEVMNALINLFAKEEKKSTSMIIAAVQETASTRSAGFDLPFYTCGGPATASPNCEKNGKDLVIYNAFKKNSYVTREVTIVHPRFGGKMLVFSMKIQDITPFSGAFNITGNNSDGNFGR